MVYSLLPRHAHCDLGDMDREWRTAAGPAQEMPSSPVDAWHRARASGGETRPRSVFERYAGVDLPQPSRRLGGEPYSGLGQRVERARRALYGYRRSDPRVYEDVCERLICERNVEIEDIAVSVADGIVKLEGSVPVRWMKRAAEDAAADVRGVVDVENQLRVADNATA